jgi:hypothetical protein
MATLLMILLVVGYAFSVWSLKRQEHFGETPDRRRDRHFDLLHGAGAARRGEAR